MLRRPSRTVPARPRPLAAAPLLAALVLTGACHTTAPVEDPAAAGASEEDLAAHLDEARALLDAGVPEDALLAVDRALRLDHEDGEARLLKARGSLALAEGLIAKGAGGVHVEAAFTDALRAFAASPGGPEASLGRSRAAWQLGRNQEALDHARAALAILDARDDEPALFLVPEQVWADATFRRYLELRGDEAADPDDTTALYLETEDALGRWLGRAPADTAPWVQLANLRQWGGDLAGALTALEAALDRAPGDGALVERLRDVARGAGGPGGAVQALERMALRHPDQVHARYTLGATRFELAVAQRAAGEADVAIETFRSAEEDLAASATLDASYAEAALGWQVVCRAGVGWCHVDRGLAEELDHDVVRGEAAAAEVAFRSMDELLDGGILWRIEGSVASGVEGLAWCADLGLRVGDRAEAVALFEDCRALDPADTRWANNAAYISRDLGVELELKARDLCAVGELAAANEHNAEARAWMQRCWAAYQHAVELEPESVRVINDAALIQVYYLQEDYALAEEWFHRCIALGEAQLAGTEGDATARFELLNAWGDAYQNLGVIAYHRDGDVEAARAWFEKSVDMGPLPGVRDVVEHIWLAKCDWETVDNVESLAAAGWALPCE